MKTYIVSFQPEYQITRNFNGPTALREAATLTCCLNWRIPSHPPHEDHP